MWFKKLTLQEQIDKVMREARKRQISCASAKVAYMAVAVDLGYEEAANHFMHEIVKEKIQKLRG